MWTRCGKKDANLAALVFEVQGANLLPGEEMAGREGLNQTEAAAGIHLWTGVGGGGGADNGGENCVKEAKGASDCNKVSHRE